MTKINYAGFEVYEHDLRTILESEVLISELKGKLESGIVLKINHSINLDVLQSLRDEVLSSINYDRQPHQPKTRHAPNSRQVHWNYKEQALSAKFLSWSFYPWNENNHNLFENLNELFVLRNLLVDLPKNNYFTEADENFVPRLAAQFYPSGEGYMAAHKDPYSQHQFAIPTLLLSEKGKDFCTGGFYVVNKNLEKIYLDQELSFGDLSLFHTSMTHGVELVDSEVEFDEKSKSGRLMIIGAVNAVSGIEGFQSEHEDTKL